MILLYIIGVIFLILAAYFWAKLVLYFFGYIYKLMFKNKIEEDKNPYILAQKQIMENDKFYEHYEKWMRKKGDGVPIEKMRTSYDKQADNKIKKYL